MKKTMTTVWIAAAALTLAAGIVEETKSSPVLAGTAQIAPLGEVTQKVTALGTLIGNPIVPTLLLTSGQQQLVERYGRLRADAPVTWRRDERGLHIRCDMKTDMPIVMKIGVD